MSNAPPKEPAKREPFSDAQAELRVLAAILDPIEIGLLERVVNWLKPEHFFSARNRKFYEACCALYDAGVAVTPTSVKHWLEDRQRFAAVPGQDWDLMLEIAETPFEIHVEENARRIVNKHTMELVVKTCELTILEAAGFAGEATEFAGRFERKAASLAEERELKDHGLRLFTMQEMIAPIVEALVRQEPVDRCTTGIAGLDDDIGGLAKGAVNIAGADTNWGKTNLAIMVADENINLGKRVLIVSAEDDEEIYGRRVLARRARVNAERLRDRRSDIGELTRIAQVANDAPREPFFLRAIGAPAEIVASRLRRICEQNAIDLVILDYVQAFRMARQLERRVEVNEVARLFTNVIKNARVAGLMFSQLRRPPKGSAKPTKHDLKESGDLENGAEGVLLGYRVKERYRLLIDKSKNGTKNMYELDWDGNACCFLGGKLVEETTTAEQLERLKKCARRARPNGTPIYNGTGTYNGED
jgi:replicative DNA helicase